jgi:ABC-2 type transport system ATP-binding protein
MLKFSNVTAGYGENTILHEVTFAIEKGETVALLGPNGAGKSTLIAAAVGALRVRDGAVSTLGVDPYLDHVSIGPRVGCQLQEPCLPSRSTVEEVCDLYARLYRDPISPKQLCDRVGLGSLQGRLATTLSGGEQQRLCLVLAVMGRPELLFLDEMSTGLDPEARTATWDLVRSLRAEHGFTILLTSHVIEEVEALAERFLFLRHGRLVVDSTVASFVKTAELECSEYLVSAAPSELARIERVGVDLGLEAASLPLGLRVRGPHPATFECLAREFGPAAVQRRSTDLSAALSPLYREAS